MITKTSQLVRFLKRSSSKDFSFIQNLKIVYRPYICPFDDLLNALPENQSVFDFGCGGGMFLQLIAEYKNPGALGGIEISETLIDTAKALLVPYLSKISIRLAPYDGVNIPEWINQYDNIFMIDVLHHIPVEKQFSHLEKLFHLMKPGARLILKDIDSGSPWHYFNKLHDLVVVKEIGHEMNAEKLNSVLQKIGFKTSAVQRKRMYVYPHYTIVCEK